MFVLVVLVYLTIGILAAELGLTASVIPDPELAADSSGVLSVLDPLRWVINGAAGIIQMITFTWDAPPLVKTVLGVPLGFGLLYATVKLWGGGG
jgi:hypothetical protein